MMNKVLIGSAWVTSLALVYWLGLSQATPKGNESSARPPLDVPKKAAAPPTPPGVSTLPSPVPVLPDASAPDLASEPASAPPPAETSPQAADLEILRAQLKSKNPIERLSAFTALLKDPSSANLTTAIQAYEALPGGPSRFSELRMLTYAWSQVDPEGAAEWMKQQNGYERRIGFGSILDAWAKSNPDAAITWAKANYDGDENPYFIGIIKGMSDQDPARATELLTSLPYGRVRGHAASLMMENQWHKGEDVALQWVDSIEAGALKEYLVGRVAGKMANQDLERAADWAAGLPEDGNRKRAVETVAEEWAEREPAAAAEWVAELPKGASKVEGMTEVAREWARKDPASAAEWLNGYPASEEMDKPVEAYARTVARQDPETALTWAESITDEKRRGELVNDLNRIIERRQQAEQQGENAPPRDSRGGPDGGRGRGPDFPR